MKVKCVRVNQRQDDEPLASQGLSLGSEYDVLSMSIKEDGWYVEIAIDQQGSSLIEEFNQFEILSGEIPATWGVFYHPETGVDVKAQEHPRD